ncbi:tripartite tricarboxylate transporter substrate binding protein [Pseudorhodoferax sp. Leaf265]|uniref:Bug family tripartite tricarboxylate transporter substrate binding protein n=1 Tax=Pseudorhodoferax sp. Leaf265 TaxID=1736315 RepID=UPI0009EB8A9E|nr:tripartite tricarboxylate transporter substrate binding protein [Pseudorhodoferax sp. Leaf265]
MKDITLHSRRPSVPQRRVFLLAGAGSMAGAWTDTAWAETVYPKRAIELVVPYTAGGTSDLIGRIVAKGLSERLKVPVVAMNRAGAAGTLGMKVVANSPADGYVIGIGGSTNLGIAPLLMVPPPYDAVRDFTPLVMAARAPFVLVASPQSNFKSMEELVAFGKANPNKLNYGSSGVGSSHHLATELFTRSTGFQATHIPFKGGSENVAQLMSGTVDFMFESSSSILPQVKAGKVRALAVSGAERLPEISDVRTAKEAGVKDFVVESTIGVVAPAKLPQEVHKILLTALRETMSDPSVRDAIDRTGSGAPPLGNDEFSSRLRDDAQRWRKVIAEAGITGG